MRAFQSSVLFTCNYNDKELSSCNTPHKQAGGIKESAVCEFIMQFFSQRNLMTFSLARHSPCDSNLFSFGFVAVFVSFVSTLFASTPCTTPIVGLVSVPTAPDEQLKKSSAFEFFSLWIFFRAIFVNFPSEKCERVDYRSEK